MQNLSSLWNLIKSTLLESDGSGKGSIKRYAAWILLGLVVLVVIASLVPSGQFHIGQNLSFKWNHCKVDLPVLDALLTAIGTYIIGGQMLGGQMSQQITDAVKNYHNAKYGKTPDNTTKNEAL